MRNPGWAGATLTAVALAVTACGTGSAGGAYLRSRVETRFYPELWELRSRL